MKIAHLALESNQQNKLEYLGLGSSSGSGSVPLPPDPPSLSEAVARFSWDSYTVEKRHTPSRKP